ncbi:MAG: chloride channel protein [Oscillospiraceae bacterium]|nr:chloride channel protein [Oscillospiraceae bacterium]
MTDQNTERLSDIARGGVLSAKALVKWLILGCAVGVIVGAVGSLFAHTLLFVNNLRIAHPMIVLALPLGGLMIVALYRATRNDNDKGTNTVISSIHSGVHIPFRMAPLIFVSTAITHLFGGSAGREGAALQLGGSIAGTLGSILRLNEKGKRLMIMCGMSAGFSALFGTPLAATVFSMEVVSVGIMHYSALLPCVSAAIVAQFVARAFRVPPEIFPVECAAITPVDFLKIMLFATLAGLVSILFCVMLHKAEHLYKKHLRSPYLRITVAGILVAGLSFLLGSDYLGSGMGIIEHIFHHSEAAVPYAFLLKMLFTALTLGGGFKGGEIVPSLTIGAAFGSCMAALVGLPLELAAACGMVGVFCGVTNSPITSLLLAFELFGFAGMPYYLVTIAASYMISGRYGLYHAQKLMYDKTEPTFINAGTR